MNEVLVGALCSALLSTLGVLGWVVKTHKQPAPYLDRYLKGVLKTFESMSTAITEQNRLLTEMNTKLDQAIGGAQAGGRRERHDDIPA